MILQSPRSLAGGFIRQAENMKSLLSIGNKKTMAQMFTFEMNIIRTYGCCIYWIYYCIEIQLLSRSFNWARLKELFRREKFILKFITSARYYLRGKRGGGYPIIKQKLSPNSSNVFIIEFSKRIECFIIEFASIWRHVINFFHETSVLWLVPPVTGPPYTASL